jgi:hypothetical protein
MKAVFHPKIGNPHNTIHSYLDSFKTGSNKNVNLSHPYFNFDTPAFKQSKNVEIPFIKQNIKESKPIPLKKVGPIPLQNPKVENMKPIPIENPFKIITNGKDIEPLKHDNPQYYQYKLYKNSLADIALAHMDEEAGEETEFTKARGEFMNQYERENPAAAQQIKEDTKTEFNDDKNEALLDLQNELLNPLRKIDG